MLVPAMQSMGTCISSSTLSTPTCAPPLAPPPASTRPMRGLLPFCASCACTGRDAASTAAATSSAPEARAVSDRALGIMPANLVVQSLKRHRHWGHGQIDCLEVDSQLQLRTERSHVVHESIEAAAVFIIDVDDAVAERGEPFLRGAVTDFGDHLPHEVRAHAESADVAACL